MSIGIVTIIYDPPCIARNHGRNTIAMATDCVYLHLVQIGHIDNGM